MIVCTFLLLMRCMCLRGWRDDLTEDTQAIFAAVSTRTKKLLSD